MRKLLLLFFCLLISLNVFSKGNSDRDSVEIYIIDNYITPEKLPVLIVSFFTNLPVKSKIIFKTNMNIWFRKLAESHKDSIDISNLKLKSKQIHFIVQVEDSLGRKYNSEIYEVDFPKEVEIKSESNFLLLCFIRRDRISSFLRPYMLIGVETLILV